MPPRAPLEPGDSRELCGWAGHELGVSAWHEITQETIDAFAAVTGDDYWLHTDPERAADSRYGTTIAHGLLTLSLAPTCTYELISYRRFAASVNYGLNRVRFPAPVPVDSQVRMRATVAGVEELEGGAQLTLALVFERQGGSKPVCVAETVTRVFDREPGDRRE
ncbi:MAG: MaoC family dehydratase [Solirubrobacterales bacterium]|nr:MaoC family dehydratase [Solirubrobacterales bacterium]